MFPKTTKLIHSYELADKMHIILFYTNWGKTILKIHAEY